MSLNNLPAWISILPATTFPKWQIVDVQYVAPEDVCNNGSVNTYVKTLDKNGAYQAGIQIFQEYPDGKPSENTKPFKDAIDYCGQKYGASFYMSGDSSFSPERGEHGPYTFYADGNSDKVSGLGLPLKRHVQYVIIFQFVDNPVPPPTEKWVITYQDTKKIITELR